MTDIHWTTEKRRLGDLMPRNRNPVKISDHDADHLKTSVERFGPAIPMICQPNGDLIDGHQRQKVMFLSDEYGEDYEIDVRVPSRPLTSKEVDELAIRLRRNTGEWDWEILETDYDKDSLVEWGFLSDELGEWKPTKEKKAKVEAELEISPELFERHDYVVLYCDNEFDWQVLCEILDIKQMQGGPVGKKTIIQKGVGRVVPVQRFFEAIEGKSRE